MIGTEGIARIAGQDFADCALTLTGRHPTRADRDGDGDVTALADLLRAVRNRTEPTLPTWLAPHVAAVLDAARQAAKTGKRVEL
jgi:predicted dehydrogenase